MSQAKHDHFAVRFKVKNDLPLPKVYERLENDFYKGPQSMIAIPMDALPPALLNQLQFQEKAMKVGYRVFRSARRLQVVSRDPYLGYPKMVVLLDILRARNLPPDELFRSRTLEVILRLVEVDVPGKYTGMIAVPDRVDIISDL